MAEAATTHAGIADWAVSSLAPALGAEVRGVDLGRADGEQIEAIRELLLEHLVLFFPEQHLSVEDHVAFGRNFGVLEGHPNLKNPFTDHPELFELAASKGGVADEWHMTHVPGRAGADVSGAADLRCPPTGGRHLWSSPLCGLRGAFGADEGAGVEGLTGTLHDAHPQGTRRQDGPFHPVVRVAPRNRVVGRSTVSEHFTRRIVEMNARASRPPSSVPHALESPPPLHGSLVARRHRRHVDNPLPQHFVLNDFRGRAHSSSAHGMATSPLGVGAPRSGKPANQEEPHVGHELATIGSSIASSRPQTRRGAKPQSPN